MTYFKSVKMEDIKIKTSGRLLGFTSVIRDAAQLKSQCRKRLNCKRREKN